METMKILATVKYIIECYEYDGFCTVTATDITNPEEQFEYITDIDKERYNKIVGFFPLTAGGYDLVCNLEEHMLTFEISCKKDYVNFSEYSDFDLIKTFDNQPIGFTYCHNGIFYNIDFDSPIDIEVIDISNSTNKLVTIQMEDYREFTVTLKESESLRTHFKFDFDVLNTTTENIPYKAFNIRDIIYIS